MNCRVLVVDDELDVCQIIKYNLEDHGIKTDIAESAEDALKFDLSVYQVILLDVMMAGISGHDLLKIIREEHHLNTPVIFISALGTDDDLEKGFEYGADDYIRKPFSVREVVLRVKALADKIKRNGNQPFDVNTDAKIDNQLKAVKIGNTYIEFTRTEYDIFRLLYQQPGKVYSRHEIMQQIWDNHSNILGRTVDVNITRIRKKMGPYGHCIVTRSGYGYYFDSRKIATV